MTGPHHYHQDTTTLKHQRQLCINALIATKAIEHFLCAKKRRLNSGPTGPQKRWTDSGRSYNSQDDDSDEGDLSDDDVEANGVLSLDQELDCYSDDEDSVFETLREMAKD